MKFRDLTILDSKDEDLSFDEIAKCYQAATGRTLELSQRINQALFDSIKIVRYPNPIGFAVVANKFISKGSALFYYGGRQLDVNEEGTPDKLERYAVQIEIDGKKCHFDAEKKGDIASLFSHLPCEDELTDDGYKGFIQTANVELTDSSVFPGTLLSYALTDISQDTIIGFDYGRLYWEAHKTRPFYFRKRSADILDPAMLPMHVSRSPEGLPTFFSRYGCCPPHGSTLNDQGITVALSTATVDNSVRSMSTP